MTIEETVKHTPLDQRPILNHNGMEAPMDDTQFAKYLHDQANQAARPDPGPTQEQ